MAKETTQIRCNLPKFATTRKVCPSIMFLFFQLRKLPGHETTPTSRPAGDSLMRRSNFWTRMMVPGTIPGTAIYEWRVSRWKSTDDLSRGPASENTWGYGSNIIFKFWCSTGWLIGIPLMVIIPKYTANSIIKLIKHSSFISYIHIESVYVHG